MTELKPYLIRAIYDWIVDNHFTPHLLVNAENPHTVLPRQFVQDGRIILNIRPQAVEALSLGNDTIEFNTRFNGKSMYINAPINSVLAIYAKENGRGMVFDGDETPHDLPPSDPVMPPKKEKPKLRVLK